MNTLPLGFSFVHSLPEGFYGPTVLAYDEQKHCNVLVKCIEKNVIGNEYQLRQFIHCVETLKLINSPSIVHYSKVIETDKFIYLVRKFINCLTLSSFVIEGISHESSTLIGIWKSIIRIINYLHKHQIFPNFIKPNNIFIVDKSNIMITDFLPLPKELNPIYHRSDTFDLAFMAPEFFTHQNPMSVKSDVWSLGILLHFILTHEVPYNTSNIISLKNDICNCKISQLNNYQNSSKFEGNKGIYLPEKVSNLLDNVFVENPGDRPSLYEILISDVDFKEFEFINSISNSTHRSVRFAVNHLIKNKKNMTKAHTLEQNKTKNYILPFPNKENNKDIFIRQTHNLNTKSKETFKKYINTYEIHKNEPIKEIKYNS